MTRDLKKLYSDIIKQHNETPVHFERVDGADTTLKAYNPVCGDQFDLFVGTNGKQLSQLHFYGFGCAISKASTSILVKHLEGKSLSDAAAICNDFIHFIQLEITGDALLITEEFKAFEGVHDFPERYVCAALPWVEMKKFIDSRIHE